MHTAKNMPLNSYKNTRKNTTRCKTGKRKKEKLLDKREKRSSLIN